jgi:hypothetical protein
MNGIVAQLVTKFPAFCGIRGFSILFTRVCQVRELCLTFRNILCDGFLAPRPIPKLNDHPLALRDCLFDTFAATLHICPIHNLRTRQAMVTEDPLNTACMINGQTKFHMHLNRTLFSLVMKLEGIAIAPSFSALHKNGLRAVLAFRMPRTLY